MRRLIAILIVVSALVPLFSGCAGGGSDSVPLHLYYLREPSSSTVTSLYATGSGGQGRTKLLEMDASAVVPDPSTLLFENSSVYDEANKAIYVKAYEDVNEYVVKVDRVTGVATELWTGTGVSCQGFYLSGASLGLLTKSGVDGFQLWNVATADGTVSLITDVNMSAVLSAGWNDVDVFGGNLVLDDANDILYSIMRRSGGAAEQWVLVAIDVGTGVATLVSQLADSPTDFEYSALYLDGANLRFLAANGTASLSLMAVPVAGGDATVVLALDETDIGYYPASTFTLVSDGYALNVDKSRLYFLVVATEVPGGANIDMLAYVDTTTGVITKIDQIDGCFYGVTYVP